MKRTVLTTIAIFIAVAAFAQESVTGGLDTPSDQPKPDQRATTTAFRSSGTRIISSMIAYGSFSVGGEERFGPTIVFQYSPNRYRFPAVDFFAGALIRTGTSGPVDTRGSIPVASMFAPYSSPYSDYRNDNLYRTPHFSIGMAFLGTDLTFYLAEGDVRPYLGVGGSLAFWSYAHQLNGTLAPDAKAGLAIDIANSLSGFAEVRRLFGVPNVLGSNAPKFDGMTSAAIGVSFAPRFR